MSYPSTEHAVNKINYLHTEKNTYLICNTNLILTNMYAQSMYDALGLYFTFDVFFHTEQKYIKYGISLLNISQKIPDIFLTLLKTQHFS